MKASPLESSLRSLRLVGCEEVELPLSRTLFSDTVIRSVADRFPSHLRVHDGRLLLSPSSAALETLREALMLLYETIRP